MAKPYVVHMLWRAETRPEWELVTEHAWFDSPIWAGFFANCLSTPSPAGLVLARGSVFLLLSDDRIVPLPPEALEARHLGFAARDIDIVDDFDYETVDASPADLFAAGLDGLWLPVAYVVEGPTGPLEATIETGDTGTITGIIVTGRTPPDLSSPLPAAVIPTP